MSFRNLDLNLLRVFDEVMAERNLSRAAASLVMTQPAVSTALKRLRERLGDEELFTRNARGVTPTAFSERIWPDIREALHLLRDTLTPSQFEVSTARSIFRLSMADATAALLAPLLIQQMAREAPSVSVRIVPLTTRDPRNLLDHDAMDLAIGHFPTVLAALAAPDAPNAILHTRLYDGEYVCVMRKDHPQAMETLSLDKYCAANHLLVSFSGRAFGLVDEALAGVGRTRRVVLTVNQFFTAGRVVLNSDLLTVMPKHFIDATGMRSDFAVRALPFTVPPVHVDLLWHRRNDARADQRWLRTALVRAAAGVFPEVTA
jgi:DNA-binding transcriptional LysR family regulator